MNLYVISDASGRILKYGQARDTAEDAGASMAAQAGAGQSWVAVADYPNAQISYVVDGVVTPRPVCPVTLNVAGRVATLTNVPAGAEYSVTGDASFSGACDASGTLELTFGTAGSYQIAVACFPSIDFAQGVTLT